MYHLPHLQEAGFFSSLLTIWMTCWPKMHCWLCLLLLLQKTFLVSRKIDMRSLLFFSNFKVKYKQQQLLQDTLPSKCQLDKSTVFLSLLSRTTLFCTTGETGALFSFSSFWQSPHVPNNKCTRSVVVIFAVINIISPLPVSFSPLLLWKMSR